MRKSPRSWHRLLLGSFIIGILILNFLATGALVLSVQISNPTVLNLKWTVSNLPRTYKGPAIGDINNDGINEVIFAGANRTAAYRGTNGTPIWSVTLNGVGEWVTPQMADINRDGKLEIIVPLEHGDLAVLNSSNGAVIWKVGGLGGSIQSSPVIGDIDGSGYPTIFVASEDSEQYPNGTYRLTGRVTSIGHDGVILHQTFIWRPCGGGLSLADTDNDGEFELYVGDRSQGYPDGGYGRGVHSFWAKNLTTRWERPDILSSSHIPMPVDVNNDGKMEIVAGNQRGGLFVLNATDGSTIRSIVNSPDTIPQHYQPSIYDIDGDGNQEVMLADGDHSYGTESNFDTPDIVVWDLVNWQLDHRMNVGRCRFAPQVGEITGDGKMDLIAANYSAIFVFDPTFSWTTPVAQVTGLTGTLGYPVIGDIDGDGLNEIVVTGTWGRMYAFDTLGMTSDPRPRSQVQFYSERRLGVAEFVPYGPPAPIISQVTPSEGAIEVPKTITRLSFNLADFQYDLMNYSATTWPFIGESNGTNVSNGIYSVPVSNINFNTLYSLNINVTDGEHWTNKTYDFSTETTPLWWNLNWQYRRTITIDPSKVDGDQTNFPVLVDFTDSNIVNRARTDGRDFVFVDENDSRLSYEIESYQNTSGHLVAWIEIPFVSSTSFTTFYLYYGNPNANDQQNRTALWDTNYKMVLHLDENIGLQYDSTVYGNNGTPLGGVVQGRQGMIDFADQFDGVNDYVKVPNNDTISGFTQAFTASFWMRLNDTGRRQTIFNKYNATNNQRGWYIEFYPNHPTYGSVLGFSASPDGITPYAWYASFHPNLGEWYYVAVVWKSNSPPIFYIDGELVPTIISNRIVSIFNNVETSLGIGKGIYSNWYFKGTIDEVRLSDQSVSAGWIFTSYSNQEAPSGFYVMGKEESLPTSPIIADPAPIDDAINVPVSLQELSFNLTDYQNDLMNFTIITSPNVGSPTQSNVTSGRYVAPISGLDFSTTYTWTINVTDGSHATIETFVFTTQKGERPPIQGTPLLISSSGTNKTGDNLIAYNQSTIDPDFDKVTNIYTWYKNDMSMTNLLLPFDTNSTTIAKDYTGYGNNGTVYHATWISQGMVGGAYSFNGISDYISIPNSATLDGGHNWNRMTIELWVMLSSNQKGKRIIAEASSYQLGFQSSGSSNRLYFGIVTKNSYYEVEYSTPLALNTWYHVVATYTANVGSKIYLNGTAVPVTVTSGAPAGNIWSKGYALEIGRHSYYPTTSSFAGIVDEVKIYGNLTLSPEQISQNYVQSKNGLSSNSTIVAQQISVGDIWKSQVTPNDGQMDGLVKFSNSITIVSNNKPSASDLMISPASAYNNSTLTASYAYNDPDGNPENGTEIRWYKNGTLQSQLNDTLVVPSEFTGKGDVWHFTVRPKDGIEFGNLQASSSITILNTPPSIVSRYPQSATLLIHEGQLQDFNVTCSDIDGDTLTVEWLVNGTQVLLQTGVSISQYTFNATTVLAGSYIITVIVKDNEAQTSYCWILTVEI